MRTGTLAETAAEVMRGSLVDVLARQPRASIALSGGSTPFPVFELLARCDLPWNRVDVYQVDERIRPAGHPERNLAQIESTLGARTRAVLHPMPVNTRDLRRAARRYGAALPRLDVVHLGLGDDGHTASLVPGDPVLAETERLVAITHEYRGARRMTLTFPALARAGRVIWIVGGVAKASMVDRLLAGDGSIPAGRVQRTGAVLVTDLLV